MFKRDSDEVIAERHRKLIEREHRHRPTDPDHMLGLMFIALLIVIAGAILLLFL